MKRILIPTDFSDTATNAFIHALEFANLIEAELVLLHIFDLPVFDSQFCQDNYATIYSSYELAKFEVFKDEIPKLRAIAEKRNLSHIRIQHRLMNGDLVKGLKTVVKEDKIDFIIMGTSGATGWLSYLLGSNTSAVISEVDVPILCVSTKAEYKEVKNIGFTTRYRERDKKALKRVLKVAKKMNAEVKSLFVQTKGLTISEDKIKDFEKEFENEPISFSIISSEKIQETILDFVLAQKIDVLGMITYKRNFFESILEPSFTQKMSKTAEIPVLIMHQQ